MQGVCSSLGEVRAEAIAANVFHFVFVGEWGDRTLRVLSGKVFVKKDEVGETTADSDSGFGEGGKIGLLHVLLAYMHWAIGFTAYICRDKVGNVSIFRPIVLF